MSASIVAASNADELLQLKAKTAELELQLAQSNETIVDLRRQNAEFATKLQKASNAVNSRVTTVRDENYQLQKELMGLTEQKNLLEKQLEKAQEGTKTIQSSITREVQRAKDEGERQMLFLRSQLIEQKELNTQLQEKVVSTVSLAENLRGAGMEDFTTDKLLITSDAVLHRLTAEHRSSSYKGKYDVTVEINGRNMVLSGKRLNVQLLKAEVLQVLNEMYAAATEPTKYIAGAKLKDQTQKAESDHLRRTIVTHETTINSLHTALQHAQDRTNQAIKDAEEARRRIAVAEEEANAAQSLRSLEQNEHDSLLSALREKLADAEETGKMALESLKAEAAVSARYRDENTLLRERIQNEVEAKETAERTVYVAAEKLKATQDLHAELQHHVRTADASIAKSTSQDQEIRRLTHLLDEKQRIFNEKLESLSLEAGTKSEKLMVLQSEMSESKVSLQGLEAERDQLRREATVNTEVISELRSRLHGFGAGDEGASNNNRMSRLEEENVTLRQELQQAFIDMKTVASSIKETRSVRERAIADLEKVEIERSQLLEERQQLEVQMIQERMQSRQKQADLESQLATVKEELDHQKQRVEMLHLEYQRKISETLPSTAASTVDESDRASLMVMEQSSYGTGRRGTDSPTRQMRNKPPQRTPMSAASMKPTAGTGGGGTAKRLAYGTSPTTLAAPSPLAAPAAASDESATMRALHSPSPPMN